MGREILVFLSPFFFFWLRFAFFGRANVILIARLSVLLCEFARHFFISFPREIADAEEGETSSSFWPLSRASLYGETKILPTHLFPICSCVDSTLLALSPTVVSSAGGVCFIIGAHGQEMDVRFVPRNHVYSPARYILHACILTPSRLIGTCVRSMIHAACC